MNKNYIEWGHFRGKQKKKNFIVYGEDAYDLWHLTVRYKEVLKLRDLQKKKIKFSSIPRKEKFLILFMFCVLSQPKKLIELGCSAMEVIDGLELCSHFYKNKVKKNFINKIKFSGIEISSLLRSCAKDCQKKRKPIIYKTASEFTKNNFKNKETLLHDFGVSNYAFKNSTQFINFLNKFDSAYFKLSFAIDKTFSINPRGKQFTFFSINEMKKLNKPLHLLFEDSKIKNWTILEDDKQLKKKVLTGFFYFGEIKNLDKVRSKLQAEPFLKKINFKPTKIN